MQKYVFLFLFFFSFNILAEPYYIKISATQVYEEEDTVITEKDYGSGVRWNNEYVVTAKHVSFAPNSVYKCSKDCDLQFIKMPLKGKGFIPEWRERKPYEKVTIIGNSIGGKTIVSEGKDIKQSFYVEEKKVVNSPSYSGQSNTMVYATTAQIVEGQSGGPVFGNDGKVLGFLIGKTVVTSEIGKKFNVSIYVPYSIIKKEWDKFKGV